MDFAEPKWHAAVAVYDSLPEAGWLIESVRQQVLQVVLNLTFVFGKDPVDKDLYENAMGFWGRDFAQQTEKQQLCLPLQSSGDCYQHWCEPQPDHG